MLHMDAAETEQDAVDQVFDTRMKRAVAVLQALLAYYRVKKVPPIATKERIEIEDAALAVATGEFCSRLVALVLTPSGSARTPSADRLPTGTASPAGAGSGRFCPFKETARGRAG